MKIFKGENFIEFTERFLDDNSCKEYLAHYKWNDGFVCKKCGHDKATIRKDHTRTCNFCKHNESPTAQTAFHKVKFGVKKAFHITFEMVNSTKSMSAIQISKRYGITRKTAWLFMHKIRKVMKSSEHHPMDGNIQVDEFTIGGKEQGSPGRSYKSNKKKIIASVELTEKGGVKRVYALRINDYSSESLKIIFEKHISKKAKVNTDKWKGYRPLMSEYDINQTLSDRGRGMPQIHIIIHQIKSWLRTIYSWVHPKHIDSYLDEFSFRINRSIYKYSIFNKIIERVANSKHIAYADIAIARK